MEAAAHYEQLGKFYLGKESVNGEPVGDTVLYDSRDLLTHGVVLGMTGSGKTGLCMAILEEAAMDGVPAIVIDPKGDIANLMLTFPKLQPADFEPWIQEEEAARKGLSLGESASRTARMWEKGLQDWGQGKERVRSLKDKVDINLFTPGSQAGIPVSILASLAPPPPEVIEDRELFNEQVVNTVASLLSMIGMKEGSDDSREAVLLSSLFQHAWAKGETLTFESLIHLIQDPPFDKIGVLDLDSFLGAKDRMDLALQFNRVLALPGFSSWCEGVPLDVARLLHDPSGKPRISVFSIAHLNDEDRMFFTSLLLNQMVGWMRKQSGTTSLRAMFYMDEIFGYLPPTANPPSKRPLMIMLKQARAFGLGCLLATQNPVDLDYKALSNIGTWFLGRLQTERDKLRVLDGLQGAAGASGNAFDRADLERFLSGLGSRVFLMNNVHEDIPVLFHVRWVMSYLAGPLTRSQIRLLMNPKRSQWIPSKEPPRANPMAMKATQVAVRRPILGVGVEERFVDSSGSPEGVVYHPYLLRKGVVYFRSKKWNIDASRDVVSAHPMRERGIDWENALENLPRQFATEPLEGLGFGELPGFAMNQENYREVKKEFSDHLYHHERAEILVCPLLGQASKLGEEEGEFRARLGQFAREQRDDRIEELRARVDSKLNTLTDRLRTAEGQLAREKAEASSAKMQAGVSIIGSLLKGLLGRKSTSSTITGASSAVGRASSAYKQQQDVSAAEAKVKAVHDKIADLEKETELALDEIRSDFETENLELETETIKPTRAGVKVDKVALLWVPMTSRGEPGWGAG